MAVSCDTCDSPGAQYFGGPVPWWLEMGHGAYCRMAHFSKGKPEKPPSRHTKQARFSIDERKTPLDELFATLQTSIEVDDIETANLEAWAWHWFLLHGPAKSAHKKTYEKHLATLRETGDPLEARQVWKDTDLSTLRDKFVDWAKSWK